MAQSIWFSEMATAVGGTFYHKLREFWKLNLMMLTCKLPYDFLWRHIKILCAVESNKIIVPLGYNIHKDKQKVVLIELLKEQMFLSLLRYCSDAM